jgi:anti-sigma B factor antagonist
VGTTDDAYPDAGMAVLALTGELDVANADDIRARGAGLLSADVRELVVDLSGVTFLDSTALGAVLDVRSTAERVGVPLRLEAVPPGIRRVISIAGLAETLGLEPA